MSVGKKIAMKLGFIPRSSFHGDVYHVDEIHDILSKAIRVSGNGVTFFVDPSDGTATHRGWVIGLETKKSKTAEELLADIVALQDQDVVITEQMADIIDEIKDYQKGKK